MSEAVVTDLLVTRRREEDATGRLAELEEQFVQQLDETERYKQEVQALQQLVACFKQECDANGIKPNFPPALQAHAQRLYAKAAPPQAQAANTRPKDGLWSALTPEQQMAARTLGWKDGAMWDDGLSPESGTKTWAELTGAQKMAAVDLGWDQRSWEAEALQ